ncbi:alpha/beta hydrolase [Schnuerera sp. xch1]|uniref:alpha/beta fold hydrolase n=1 Tax=Schnuerera sp. xch1 TaxID=2874283 RepID=UPI001CBC3C86|nr:alpha/beta hydrolase [Schnuerera sp. xch1]MBZ2175391.1 alpha/beta hydrolase [Schnuerera sp. xch1]
MPYIKIKDKNIYYREYGNGEPVVFLNGVMMNTSSWGHFTKIVSKNYRMITIDLLDQGRSDSCEEEYTVRTQAEILKSFLDEIGIDKIHLVGMSYGGKVALTFTLNYQHMIKSLILTNTDSYTTRIMKEFGKGWGYAASTLNGEIFSSIVLPYMYSYNYYEEKFSDVEGKKRIISKILNKKWSDRFIRNLSSALDYDVSHRLNNIKVPTLIISSELDAITLIKYQELMHKQIKNSKWIVMKDVGHAALYEKPNEYISMIMDFLSEI